MTRRKPTQAKKLAGTYRPDRSPDREPEPEAGPVSMPRGVLPRSARKMWRAWAPELQRLGLLTPVDAPAFMLACVWAGVAVDAAALIREAEEAEGADQGLITEDDRDRAAKNRALSVLRAASHEFRQFSTLFGFTPGDRSGLSIPVTEEEDDLAALLFRRVREVEAGDDDD